MSWSQSVTGRSPIPSLCQARQRCDLSRLTQPNTSNATTRTTSGSMTPPSGTLARYNRVVLLVCQYLLRHSVCSSQVATLLLTKCFSELQPPLNITPNAQGFFESGFALWMDRCEQQPDKRHRVQSDWKLRDTRHYEVSTISLSSCGCTIAVV